MSAIGTTQTLMTCPPMSAFGGKADIACPHPPQARTLPFGDRKHSCGLTEINVKSGKCIYL